MKNTAKLLKNKYINLPNWLKTTLFVLLLSVPVIVWVSPFVLTGRKVSYNDNDYYLQLYEALRISIVKYHQFPWLNSWMVGGVPLFGNPQLGFLSLQVPLVLLFGTVVGFKISWMVYYLLGFWGMYLLLHKSIKANKVMSCLLAYAFIFCGFFAAHIPGGHYTFTLYFFAPWIFWLYFSHIDNRFGWVGLGLAISLLVLSSPHYAAIQTLIVLAVLIPIDILANGYIYRILPVLKSLILMSILVVYRMFFVYQFSSDFPRATDLLTEPPLHFKTLLKALLFHPGMSIKVPDARWGWGETTASIGVVFLIVLIGCIVVFLWRSLKNKNINTLQLLLLTAIILTLLIAKGDFGPMSPYAIMKHLPVLSQMRIPGRWLIWTVTAILCFIATINPSRRPLVRYGFYSVIFIGVVELWLFNFGFTTSPIILNPEKINTDQNQFQQYKGFQTSTVYDPAVFTGVEYLYESTINNVGQIKAAESLVDTRTYPTIRCGVNEGCPFVISSNAKIDIWSPNRIELTRTGEGPIELNMNPSNYWLVNGKRIFADYKVAEPSKQFIIDDPSQKIIIEAIPKYSVEYWLGKINNN